MRKRTRVWYIVVGIVIPLLGCMLAMTLAYSRFPNLPGALESRMNLDNLTQVVVPGSEDIEFPKKGAYAVYYEYRSVVDDALYHNSEIPPALTCTVTSKVTGVEVETAHDYVKTNTYATKNRERVGVLIQSLTIKTPGIYTFSCQYTDGHAEPKIVLAVGPNFVWEFFSIVAAAATAIAAASVAFVGLSLMVLIFFTIATIRRRRVKSHSSQIA